MYVCIVDSERMWCWNLFLFLFCSCFPHKCIVLWYTFTRPILTHHMVPNDRELNWTASLLASILQVARS